MKSKKITLAGMAVVVSLSMAGCSTSGPVGTTTPPVETAAAPSLSGSLEMWVMGSTGPAMEGLAAGFTKETGVAVTVQAIPWGDVRAKMSTAIASGQGPDVIQVGLDRIAEWADAGGLLDLTDRLANYPELAPENFFSASASTMVYDAKTYTVPWISDTRVLYYRTDILDAAGFSDPPATWDQWSATAKALAARGDGQYGMGFNTADVNIPLILTWSQGAEIYTDGAFDFTSSAYTSAVEFEHSFFANGYTPARALADADMIAGFKDGSIPMFISYPSMARSLNDQAPEIKGKWSIAMVPKQVSATSVMAGSNLGVFADSDNKAAAVAFMAYLDRPEVQLAWNSVTYNLPAVTSAMSLLAGNDLNKVYFSQMQDAKVVPVVENWGGVSQEINRATEQINLGNAAIDATVASLQKAVAAL